MSWQEKLDEMFPYGGSLTQIQDVPESVDADDNVTFLTPRLLAPEEEDEPTVTAFVVEFQKEVSFVLTGVEETSPGVHLLSTPEGQPDWLLSTNLDQEVKNALRNTRREWYGE